MAVMIDSWPLPQKVLRFARTGRGTYQAIVGVAPRQTRYTIAGRHGRWRVERSSQKPGGGWTVDSLPPASHLSVAMDQCYDDARENGVLRSLTVATHHAGPRAAA
jgi:hypothetical protein